MEMLAFALVVIALTGLLAAFFPFGNADADVRKARGNSYRHARNDPITSVAGSPMPDDRPLELKAFLPAKDFELSKHFYKDLGFELKWTAADDSLARFGLGAARFLLVNHNESELAAQTMMHLLVPDIDHWHQRIRECRLAEKYSVRFDPPIERPWGTRDLALFDPSGVQWRIGEVLETYTSLPRLQVKSRAFWHLIARRF